MSKSFLYLVVLLFLATGYPAFSRAGGIAGTIVDRQNKPLADANIVLLKDDSVTFVKSEISDENGHYRIESLQNGSYLMKVMLMGYVTYGPEKITIIDNGLTLPNISLDLRSTALKEVAIRDQKPMIEVQKDRLVVNVENSIVNTGSSAMDVLSRSPGVTVDQNDNVSLKGKQGVLIMINGKRVPLSGQDLANMLKSTSSSSIEKVEIMTNPSAKYDAAGNGGIINIIMRKDQHMGWNGSVNGSYGQGVYPKASGGTNLNYRNKDFNFYVNYNYLYRKGFNDLHLTRSFYDNNYFIGAYNQVHEATFPFKDHLLSTGIDYNLSSKTTIGIGISGGDMKYTSRGYVSNIATDGNGVLDSTSNTTTNSSNTWDNYTLNLNYRHKFDSAGRELTTDLDYARYWNQNYQDLFAMFYTPEGMPCRPLYHLYGDVTGITQIRSVKVDYIQPLKNGVRLEGGVKSSFVTADNAPSFYDESAGGKIFDSTKSDHFIYSEIISAAYINVSKDWGKWGFQFGLRVEQTLITGDEKITDTSFSRNYIQLFPSLAMQRHIDKDNDLGLTLSRRIDRPGYDQLNPYKFYADPTTIKEGDPTLNPALSYSIELSHTYKQHFITTFNYTNTQNVISEVLLPTAGRITIQGQRNLASMNYFGVSCAYQFRVNKWWSNVTNFNAYYSQYKGFLANSNLNNGEPTFDLNTVNSLLLPKGLSAELSFYYQAAQVYGYMDLNPSWMLNIGLQKALFENRATIKLSATDIFWHGYPSASSYYNDYNESFIAKRDTRQYTISFTYRFGKNTIAPVRRRSGGAEEEKKRVGNGAA